MVSNIRKTSNFMKIEFFYNGHLQALGALSIAFFSAYVLNIKMSWDFFIISYLGYYTVFLFNRYKEIDKDLLTNKIRTEHNKMLYKHTPLIFFLTLSTLLILFYFFYNPQYIIYLLLINIFGVFYTLYLKKQTEKIYLFKNICVALIFTAVVYSPLIYYSIPLESISRSVIWLSVFVFIKALFMQIMLDIKDIESDKKENLKTLSILLGKEKTIKILYFLSFVIGFMPLVFYLFGIFPSYILILLLDIPFNLYALNLIKKEKFSGYILESGEFILWSTLIFIGRILI